MTHILTTTATYQKGIVLPKIIPDFSPEEIVVTFKSQAHATAAKPSTEEWRKKAISLKDFLNPERHPEFADPVTYVRRMRDLELRDDPWAQAQLPPLYDSSS